MIYLSCTVSFHNIKIIHIYPVSKTYFIVLNPFSLFRVRPLVMAVKTWAKKVGINDASCQTISSYGWTLMVIHFLQFRARPKVLPPLLFKFCIMDISLTMQILIIYVWYYFQILHSFDRCCLLNLNIFRCCLASMTCI